MEAPFFASIASALGVAPDAAVSARGSGAPPSVFAVGDFAAATIAAAGAAAAELAPGAKPDVVVDRRLASLWFAVSAHSVGWRAPEPWDALAGDYRARDGWIRLHTNAPLHRAAALAVLAVAPVRETVAAGVRGWEAEALESAIVGAGGCAAVMRSRAAWADHPQGCAVAAEPLIATVEGAAGPPLTWVGTRAAPLEGVRVLDLTRVLAGPTATRFLAGLGADVLRIDPPDWDEPGVLPDVTLGKRRARLDLRAAADRNVFERLLAQANILVHGYRPGALEGLGYGADRRGELCPGLVEVSLDAYGWTGPWQARRGFDSLVQMSCGIADAGMARLGKDRPFPLPVQALDHGCGYLMAAAALTALRRRRDLGVGSAARLSLARVAEVLMQGPEGDPNASLAPAGDADFSPGIESTAWGPMRRLASPLTFDGAPLRWRLAAGPLGSDPAQWPGES